MIQDFNEDNKNLFIERREGVAGSFGIKSNDFKLF